jgi:hypothetical protein
MPPNFNNSQPKIFSPRDETPRLYYGSDSPAAVILQTLKFFAAREEFWREPRISRMARIASGLIRVIRVIRG